ncbi:MULTISPECIES: Gfo/Idh/MocA family oxidoreductase [unclassified Marinobacterium]|jgi:2-hydroxy-4-carboxymuconate semialdehyde hemiacetal dehydrogenase|uniref:Gfo/Idh/MocA family oxidoreductase n=1 Tax=unclassified Marinobacterium TaxID=2644139 RepID=UPI001569C173|nr:MULTISPECIES: Gfo/Idh/MocA family oxidoreductase [unclassified Marinobacterium]NRP09840.1 4-carboxy-2-hydroxymuconate-6-semialdehyde dehydrogenase [Marinobacterium sp. xm-g-48]NRP28103.1 4-carboxy-2-hydroxymuconate-6-semialdehyde dehydrogenase [Marinobacterium sp. xm-d-420]NRP36278.1 4-carboxy-2-hydroxymuconate-6-semialdehyde dehydrogenase [Marinobacterium sp. xm-d-579]NRP39295.1 4-carboxy-2-hydroxymuconate-6-semialdehyde dehydrogenase [Marinobacterium sp. xm-a-121]NRP51925.1 4-carboxy-2-hy
MRVCVAGAMGAFGLKHLDALSNIEDVVVTSVVGTKPDAIAEFAKERGIAHATTDLAESLARDDVDAVILATPTQMHASQSIQCLEAGKHVMVEIPMADNIEDSIKLVEAQKRTGLVAMSGQTRRFNPSHQWIHNKIQAGELKIQQMDVQTYFFRRSNKNALGKARSWTDHLLWHHACHTVDLFQYQTGEKCTKVQAMQGPIHPELNIAMDMSIGMKSESGALCTLSLSFNNDGPFGTFFRYICDKGTYIARYDDLVDGNENPIDLSGVAVSNNGIELQDREFISAIREGREPNSSVQQVLPAMETLHQLEQLLD